MKIVVDLHGAQTASRHRGIGRYSFSLTKNLIALAPEYGVDLHVLLNHGLRESVPSLITDLQSLIPAENLHVWKPLPVISRSEVDNLWRADASEIIRDDYIRRLDPDVVHITSLFEGATDEACVAISNQPRDYLVSATFYDLIPLKDPDRYLPDGLIRKWYELKLKNVVRADALFAISESSRQEVIKYLDYDEKSIINVSSDTSEHFRVLRENPLIDSLLFKLGVTERFIMYNGVISVNDPRKNVANLVKGYALACKRNEGESFQLVLCGGVSPEDTYYLRAIALSAGIQSHDIVFTGYIDDADLVALHNASSLHVLPSIHEGFGLPILEAMRCGVPAIASNCSSMPEVVGRRDALFDPKDIGSIASCIMRFMGNETLRLDLAKHAKDQQTKFSWASTARSMLDHWAATVPHSKKNGRLNSVSDILDQVKHLDRGSRYTDADLMNLAHSLSWNLSVTRRKRLYVDITELATYNKSTGIQRVVKSIVSEFLASVNERFDILPIARSDGRYKYATEYVTKEIDQEFFSVGKHGTVAFGAKDVFLGLDLDLQVDEGAREVLRHAREGGTKVFFVIYDVLACSHPDWFNDELFGFFRWHYEKISELADALFCISDTVADEVKQMLDQLSLRSMPLPIYSFRLGAEFVSNVKPLSEKSVPLPVPLPEKFLLMVGTIEPRKGYQCILLAMNEIWAKGSDYSLVIIGRAGWLCDELTEFIELSNYYQKQLFWISEASDALLISAYEKASGLVAASYNEGFGLPIVEAARFGLPLFLRDIPVFREVAGGSATYFSSDTFSISKQLEQWMSQIDAGSEQASSAVQVVTWQESAEELKVLVGGNVQTRNVWLVGEHYLWSLNSIFAVNVEYPFSVVEPFSILVGERTEEGLVTSEVGALHIVTSKRKLSKGRYQLTVSLGSSCIVHSILMEVRTEGRLALAQSSFEPSNNTVSALLDFENDTHGVEVDVQQGASIGLCIKSISISRLEDDEVPDDEVLISLE